MKQPAFDVQLSRQTPDTQIVLLPGGVGHAWVEQSIAGAQVLVKVEHTWPLRQPAAQ